jgi:hypothetical protein
MAATGWLAGRLDIAMGNDDALSAQCPPFTKSRHRPPLVWNPMHDQTQTKTKKINCKVL